MGVPAVKLLIALTTPLSFYKQIANFVQMAGACNKLVQFDNDKRKA